VDHQPLAVDQADMNCIRFDLRVWFAVTGFAVIAVLSAAFALLMSSYLTTTMLDREVAVTQEFLQSILGAENYGERVFNGGHDGGNEALKAFADHVRAMPEILRVNVMAPTGASSGRPTLI
jgi:hypothetical protein